MNIKDLFLRFWRSDNEKISIIRDILVALIAVFIVLVALWTYTGQWFGAPMVAIESGSMEHPDSPFGRLGTIDAGDMVLVQKIHTRDDIVTHGGEFGGAKETEDPNNFFYGLWGDVVIYHPDGKMDETQIIHRAMCWVDVNIDENDEKTYTIAELGIHNSTTLHKPSLGIKTNAGEPIEPNWSHSGYLTKGDNNNIIDQAGGIAREPVKVEWISGKARQEIPWIGTINLLFEDIINSKNTVSNVHEDCLICLGLLIAILISIPIILDLYDYFKQKKKEQIQN